MDKEQNLNKKERWDYVQKVAQEARDSIAQLFSNNLSAKEVVWALAAICGSMTEQISVQLPDISKDEIKDKFITLYKAYLSLEH